MRKPIILDMKNGNFENVDNVESKSNKKLEPPSVATDGDHKKLASIDRCKSSETNQPTLKNKDTKCGEQADKTPQLKRKLRDHVSPNSRGFTMNTPATIEYMATQFDKEGKKHFYDHLSAGGGIDGQRCRLRGAGREYWLTSSSDGRASGRFLTDEHPGDTARKRQENLQTPPTNDCSRVERVRADKPSVVLESRVAPQEKWAKEAGYKAQEGIKQIYTPSRNPKGPIESGKYRVIFDKEKK